MAAGGALAKIAGAASEKGAAGATASKSATVQAGGRSVEGIAGAVSNIEVAKQRSIQVRAQQREETKRQRIKANVNITEIGEKYKTNRVGIFNEQGITFRNTSDEVLHAFDRPVIEYDMKTKRGKGKIHISFSMLSLMGLLSPIMSTSPNPRVQAVGNAYHSDFTQLYQNAEYMSRMSSASGLSFQDLYSDAGYQDMMKDGADEDKGDGGKSAMDILGDYIESAGKDIPEPPTPKDTAFNAYAAASKETAQYYFAMNRKYPDASSFDDLYENYMTEEEKKAWDALKAEEERLKKIWESS